MSGSGAETPRWLLPASVILPLVLLLASLNLGVYHIPLREVWRTLVGAVIPGAGPASSTPAADVVLRIRLPRLLLAMFGGAALAVSGASLQAIFKNPLVFEFSLGINFGAAFGAALSLVFLGRALPPQLSAFAFGVLAVGLVLFIAGKSVSQVVPVLLSGIIVSALFQALLSLVEFVADPYALQALIFWLLGSLARATWADLWVTLPVVGLGVAALFAFRWRLNVLSLGDEEARALGVNVKWERMLVVAVATLIVAAVTAVAGVISWIGLIVPHLVRMAAGADNRRVIPLSAGFGASLLILADDVARGAASFEIPIGILTSVVGLPFFILLLRKSRKIWQ